MFFFFPCLSEQQDLHGLRRSPPTFSGTLNTPWTLPTSKVLLRYTTCTSSHTSPLSSHHARVYTNRVRCTPVSIPAMPSACLTAQKDPQIHTQYIWAFPTILRNSLSRSRSCPIWWSKHVHRSVFHSSGPQLWPVSKHIIVFARRRILEQWWMKITVELPTAPQDSWAPGFSSRGRCRTELVAHWCTAKRGVLQWLE